MEGLLAALSSSDQDIDCVVDRKELISVLNEVESMIGLKPFKDKVAQQVKSFIVNHKLTGSYLTGNMLNVLITGPPGSGKTQCGRMLAKMWSCFSQRKNRIGVIPAKGSIELEEFKHDDNFVILTRADLIRRYQGHSVDNVRNIFAENAGKTIFIDEAYSICLDAKDTFGMEVATEINNFMDKNPDAIRWIFAGYKDQIERTLFKLQPGFRRRFSAKFELGNYTCKELFSIFKTQLAALNLELANSQTAYRKFEEIYNRNGFPDFGGSTLNLSFTIKESMLSSQFEEIMRGEEVSNKVPTSLIVSLEKSEERDLSYLKIYM